MYISFGKEGDRDYMRSFCAIGALVTGDKKSFHVGLTGPDVPTVKGIEGIYPIESYRDSLKKIMRQIFEAQLLHG